MPISIWGRIKQAYSDSSRASGEGLGLYTATFTVSNARMKTMRATPYVAVKGIPGRIIVPYKVVSTTPDVTTARTGGYDIRLQWRVSSTTYSSATGDLDRTGMIGSTAGLRFAVEVAINESTTNNTIGRDLILRNVDSGEYASGSEDNEVTFHVLYSIVQP